MARQIIQCTWVSGILLLLLVGSQAKAQATGKAIILREADTVSVDEKGDGVYTGLLTFPTEGIYDQVKPLTPHEKRNLNALRFSEKDLRKQSGLSPRTKIIGGRAGLLEKGWRLPSVSVNAIQASSRKDVANIINESAWCHVGIRIVPNMDPKRTANLLMKHLKANAPWGVQVEFADISESNWWYTDPSGKAFEAAFRALSAGYGRPAVSIGCGGSIPFVGPFAKALGGAPALLIGVEDPYTNPHSENESLHLGDFRKAVRSAIHLYQELAGVKLHS